MNEKHEVSIFPKSYATLCLDVASKVSFKCDFLWYWNSNHNVLSSLELSVWNLLKYMKLKFLKQLILLLWIVPLLIVLGMSERQDDETPHLVNLDESLKMASNRKTVEIWQVYIVIAQYRKVSFCTEIFYLCTFRLSVCFFVKNWPPHFLKNTFWIWSVFACCLRFAAPRVAGLILIY